MWIWVLDIAMIHSIPCGDERTSQAGQTSLGRKQGMTECNKIIFIFQHFWRNGIEEWKWIELDLDAPRAGIQILT